MTKSYGKLCALFYDLDKPLPPAQALAFYRSEIQNAGGRALEPMCGSGRFLLPLLREGFSIDGFDSSPDMLQTCRYHCEREGLKSELTLCAAKDFTSDRKYSCAFIPASSFCLIDIAESAASLKALRNSLLPGGFLLFEAETISDYQNGGSERSVQTTDGKTLRIQSVVRVFTEKELAVFESIYTLEDGEKILETEEEIIRLQCYTKDSLKSLLQEAGFARVEFLPNHPFLIKAFA